jgi:hypothetical protein
MRSATPLRMNVQASGRSSRIVSAPTTRSPDASTKPVISASCAAADAAYSRRQTDST